MLTRAGGRSMAAVVTLAAVLVLILFSSCSRSEQDDSRDVAEQADLTAAADTTEAAGVESDAALPRLLDLGADKCIPCKMMIPIIEELRETYEGELQVDFIDVWKDRSAGEQYGVRVIPTQIFFAPDGSELFRHQGFLSREDILAKWSELGYAFNETVEEN